MRNEKYNNTDHIEGAFKLFLSSYKSGIYKLGEGNRMLGLIF